MAATTAGELLLRLVLSVAKTSSSPIESRCLHPKRHEDPLPLEELDAM